MFLEVIRYFYKMKIMQLDTSSEFLLNSDQKIKIQDLEFGEFLFRILVISDKKSNSKEYLGLIGTKNIVYQQTTMLIST